MSCPARLVALLGSGKEESMHRFSSILGVIALCGCMTDMHVLSVEDGGMPSSSMHDGLSESNGSAGAAAPSEMQPGTLHAMDMQPSEMPSEPQDPAVMQPEPGTEAMEPYPPDGSAIEDWPLCDDRATVLVTGLNAVTAIGVNQDSIYSATEGEVRRTLLDGSEDYLYLEQYVPRLLVDDDAVYWSSSSYDLNVRQGDADSSVLLPSHGAIEGVSQDADAIYAIADGNLVRVDKRSRAITTLAAGTSEVALHWSGTAVDDDYVFFVSYRGDADPDLERVRKDGSDRRMIYTGITTLMEPVTLLVERGVTGYVYAARARDLRRVSKRGEGSIMQSNVWLLQFHDFVEPVVAQDDACVYYGSYDSVVCFSKEDANTYLVLSTGNGHINALSVVGEDLYIGVASARQPIGANSWVGRVHCRPR
jgi:hypothetical protein